MTNLSKPMLAATLLDPNVEHTNEAIYDALSRLTYPVYATTKKDGIRGIKLTNLMSRTLKLIPNRAIRQRAMKLPAGFDCELYNPGLNYDEIESIVMSLEHERDDLNEIEFHVLDWFDEFAGYMMRFDRLACHINYYAQAWKDVVLERPLCMDCPERLLQFFLQTEHQNGEGICFRLGNSPYKQGRSTLNEQYLVKLCRYIRTEVTVIDLIEQMYNKNPSKYNAVGKMDRSSHQHGMIGKNTLGAFVVRSKDGLEFKVGTGVGLTDKRRKEIWDNRDNIIGQTITIKHKPFGAKIKPRSPVWIGFRKDNQ